MTFKITGQIRMPKGQPVKRPPVVVHGPSQSMCEGCEWFQASVQRCVHPRNGCTRGAHRVRPWAWPVGCPVSVSAH